MSDKHITFFNYLQNFMDSLIETFPEKRKLFEEYLIYVETKVKENQDQFIKEFQKILNKKKEKILATDESMFENDCYLMRGINFKLLWNDKYITEQIKRSIWDYLKLLYFLSNMSMNESPTDSMNDLLEQLKQIAENNKEEDTSAQGFDIEKMKEAGEKVKGMFGGEDNIVSTLIDDIAKELNNELGGKKMNMADLLTKDKNVIEKIIENVKKTVDSKIMSGEIKEEDMTASAHNVANVLQSDDISKKLFGGLDINKMMKSMNPSQMRQMQDMARQMTGPQEPRINPKRQEKKRKEQEKRQEKK